MFFDHFDAVRIINLRHRTDRRAEMLGELRRIGAQGDPRVSFFEACRFEEAGSFSSAGARGCYHSHLAILEAAAAAGQDVLILEDDADFTPAAATVALPNDWQIFYGGYYAHDTSDLHNSGIVGAHCIAFRSAVLPDLVAFVRDLLDRPSHPPIDGAYVWFRRARPEFRTVFAEPVIAIQRPSRTDIADPHVIDRIPVLRHGAGLARRTKRRIARHGFGVWQAVLLIVIVFALAGAMAMATRLV